MTLATDYELLECLYDGRATVVYRARERQRRRTPVVLKSLKPGFDHRNRLHHEYGILKQLDVDVVVRARGIEEQGDEVALVLEDLGGETLAARLARGRMSIHDALRTAAGIAGALFVLHQHRVIHKDINPSNVLLLPDGSVKVFDFDIATRVPKEAQGLKPPQLLEGTLPYISPEQTGRMNRTLDHRTDLYSLGATLYLMLTGRHPFSSGDPLEIVHGHLARLAEPPAQIDPAIPRVVSDVVMKLLEKTAELRYQSALGLKADLDECVQRLSAEGDIAPFPLGARDISDRFRIPEKLYGRSEEIARIEACFARVQEGTPQLLLVAGSSGIGKSSVIHELFRSISQARGYFTFGKFDQLKRDIPYSALLQALSELLRGLLAEPEEQLAPLRHKILAATAGLGRVLTDLLPELARIIGPQPAVEELPGAAAGVRFRFVFERFIHVFTQHGQPLVLFLDDLQWADTGTLGLLETLLSDRNVGSLLVIGAYRDNEVSVGHPLRAYLDHVRGAGVNVTDVTLGPIRAPDVAALVTDSLALDADEARALAELLCQRTGGNPFFIGEFLTMAYRSGVIAFDRAKLGWTCDLARIEQMPSTENVGQLMAARTAALAEETRQILELAAVLGNRFTLETLAIVSQRTPESAAEALDEALREGLILFIGDRSHPVYRFLHDRVQAAVYAMIPDEAKVEIHHRVGQLLLAHRPRDEQDDWLFDVLHHVNLASPLVTELKDRIEIATLNRTVALRARAAGAHAAGARHYAAAIELLPEAAWTTHHALLFELHLGRAECEYLSGDHAVAERLISTLEARAASALELSQVHELSAIYMQHRWRLHDAMVEARKALDLVGIKLPAAPKLHLVTLGFVRTKLAIGGKSTDELRARPATTDPAIRRTLRLLQILINIAFFTDQNLYALAALLSVRLTVQHGNSSYAAAGYTTYGVLLIRVLGDYEAAGAFGALARDLLERFPRVPPAATTRGSYGMTIYPWVGSAREGIRLQEEAWEIGLMSGEIVGACFSRSSKAMLLLLAGHPIEEMARSFEEDIELVRRHKHEPSERILRTCLQMVRCLKGLTDGPGSFSTADFSEEQHAASLASIESKLLIHLYWLCKMMALFLLDRPEDALSFAERARGTVDRVLGPIPSVVDYHFYDALALMSPIEDKGAILAQRELFIVRGHLRKLKRWAEHAPMNFRQKHLLVSAELARVARDDHAAIAHYEDAIAAARENAVLQDEAIALELASKFYRSRRLHDVAISYLARARQAYVRWGAHAKVSLIDKAYPGLHARASASARPPSDGGGASSLGTSSVRSLDVPSIVKATQALSREISLDRLLLRMMTVVAENAGAERGALILDEQGTPAVVAEFNARDGSYLPPQPNSLRDSKSVSEGIVTYVCRSHEPVILHDAASEGSFTAEPYVVSRKPRAVLCAPLLQKGEVAGAIYLENNLVAGAFSPERAELLSVLCAQMAISIDNARLYADLEKKVIERTGELRKAQARVVQLEKEATESQMAGGFAHEMRNALAGARLTLAKVCRPGEGPTGWSSAVEVTSKLTALVLYLREHMPREEIGPALEILREVSALEKTVDTALRHVDRSIERSLGITRMILDYAQVGKSLPGNKLISLSACVASAVQDLGGELHDKGIAVEVDASPSALLIGDPMHFQTILTNLIHNARDAVLASPVVEGSPRAIRITAVDEPEHVVLSVSDTGVGVPAELHERIFEPFFSTKPNSGTGLGLGMVRKFTSLYGGTIALESAEGRGATFRIRFPRQPAAIAPRGAVDRLGG